MTSLSKLKYLYISMRNKEMIHYSSSKPPIYYRVDNKRPASVVAILQWTLPFCIWLCSVDLFGSVVFVVVVVVVVFNITFILLHITILLYIHIVYCTTTHSMLLIKFSKPMLP